MDWHESVRRLLCHLSFDLAFAVLLRDKLQFVHSPEPLTLDERSRVRQIVLHSLPMVLFSATQGQLAHYLLCAIGTNDQMLTSARSPASLLPS